MSYTVSWRDAVVQVLLTYSTCKEYSASLWPNILLDMRYVNWHALYGNKNHNVQF